MNSNDKTVGVIGAGIVGVCTALTLQRQGFKVTIIDPNPAGEGASFGNAGCFNGSSVVPMSMPGMITSVPKWLLDPMGPLSIRLGYFHKITPWLVQFLLAGQPAKVEEQARALRSLIGNTVPLITSLAKEAGAEHLLRHEGHLYVYRTEAQFAKDQGGWELRRSNGVTSNILNADELRDFDPNLSRAFTKGILIKENGHTTNPHELVTLLFKKVIANGGILVSSRVTGFEVNGQILSAVETENGKVNLDAAVIAAGAHSKPLAALLGDNVPLDTERGYHIVIRDPEVQPRIPTTDAVGKFIATPMETGLRIGGTVEFAGLDAAPNWKRADVLYDHARALLPAIASVRPEDRYTKWMGYRPSVPDSLPVIGYARRTPNVVYAFGHGHLGMTGAPMTAMLVSELISGMKPSIDLSPFSPSRFSKAGKKSSGSKFLKSPASKNSV
ncbi:D-amino acid dehydrogenase 1 [Roseovarius sp. EC-HK134]|jgi:D-amino-acid dehydrogenase|uniref:D-amino acid dehydrogenase 1 n=3 Tax=Pseudomonadota TaxID=1224 RepID=A0A1V0RVR2_9RHOB|nr:MULTISPECIES: FAD-binding oxidoreductase [Rhodobacterales]MCR9191013.1 FAD-binding oxidoreductase [Alteromonadaceae bacterium]ARE85672.1 D-amino acid dehydrogenase 1 [Roseovarius mucosus]ARU03257.1 D-amino acid dehydrogenase 1 [Yoonia vestfoldensis]ATF04108.1 D-amino acid dehydrogenase small subunit [Phaeobacter gallaeciensis]MBW4976108.1 FAD-binding oxidoreductase [Roseovarius mucosus]